MATTTTSTGAGYFTSDSAFRTIGSAISSAISSLPLIKTSDTGQINWATVTSILSINTPFGYEIYRFNDSLQSTSPVFIKIEYGLGNYSTQQFGLWITVGTGTNGAGTLTGNVSNRTAFSPSTSDSATRTSYFSGDTNRLCFVLWPSNPVAMGSSWAVFGIERSHNAAGADTGAAVHIYWSSMAYGGSCQYLPLGALQTAPPPYVSGGWYCSVPLTGGGALSPNIYTYPIKSFNMYETLPIFNFVHFAATDFATGSTNTVVGYDGTSRTYYAPGIANTAATLIAFTGSAISPAVGLMMRYE